MAELAKIEAEIEWRWSKKEKSEKKEDRDEEEGSKDSPRKSQEKRTLLSVFY